MYADTFESLGLSPNEAKIYETLLYAGEAGVSEISVKSKVHRRNVYDALSRLVEKGLVFTIFQKGENRYQSVTPDKLMEILREKERQLNDEKFTKRTSRLRPHSSIKVLRDSKTTCATWCA